MMICRYILIGLSGILLTAYVILGLDVDLTPISFAFVIIANMYMLLRARCNFLLFIVAFILFFCNYSIIYANYTNTIVDLFTKPLSVESFDKSLNILTLFNLFLFLFVRWDYIPIGFKSNVFIDPTKKNPVILYFIYFLLIPIFFLGFTIPEIEGQRGTPSTAYEYSAILFLLLFYYSGGAKLHTMLGLAFVFIFSLQSFIFGGRIEAIQFILVAYIMLFMHRISMSKVMVAMGVMFVLMSVIGVVRGELLSGNADIGSILTSLVKHGFALDTAYAAYYASESFIYIIDKFSVQEIVVLFWEFIKSIFVGSNSDMILTSISSEYVVHYGGGITPFYFYFYMGAAGVFFVGCIIAFYINLIINLKKESSGYLKCLTVWIVSTTFRWYLYTPLPLLRGVLILTIAYYFFYYFHFMLDRLPIKIGKC